MLCCKTSQIYDCGIVVSIGVDISTVRVAGVGYQLSVRADLAEAASIITRSRFGLARKLRVGDRPSSSVHDTCYNGLWFRHHRHNGKKTDCEDVG